MLIHLSGTPSFIDTLQLLLGDTDLALTPHVGKAGLLVRGLNGSPGPTLVPHDLDDLPQLDVVHGEIGGVQHLRLGPISLPGITACPGCVAAHERDREVLRPLGSVAAPDPLLRWLGASLAARELVAHVAWLEARTDTRPPTWAAALMVGPGDLPTPVPVSRHAHCGCTWADFMRA